MIVIATLFRKSQTARDLFRSLSKKQRFGIFFDSQHLKGSQTVTKTVWEHIHHIFSSLWDNQIWKISPSVICYILGVFRSTLTPNNMYPFRDCENLSSRFKCNYLRNEKLVLAFSFNFWNLDQVFKILKQKMNVIATLFENYRLWKTCLEHSLKYTASDHSLTVNMLRGPKLLQKEQGRPFIIYFHHSERTWFGKYLPQLYVKS